MRLPTLPAQRTRMALPANPGTQPLGLGAADTPAGEAAKLAAMPEGDAKWKAQWLADEKLRKEFHGDEASFLCFKAAEARGAMGPKKA